MFTTNRFLPTAVLLVVVTGLTNLAFAGGKNCYQCGCKDHVKNKLIAVAECREIETPTYECLPTNVFYPMKGIVCKSEWRSDRVCELHRHCDQTIGCTCKVDCRFKKQFGASPCGQHSTCNVRHPVGSHKSLVPVIKWITIPMCKDCSRRCHASQK